MNLRAERVACVLWFAVSSLVGCHAENGAPAAPSVTTIIAPSALAVGETEQLSITGSPSSLMQWRCEPVDLCRVNAAGAITAVKPGTATVIVVTAQATTSATILIVPSIADDWTGQFTVVDDRIISGVVRLIPCVFSGRCQFTQPVHIDHIHDAVTFAESLTFDDVNEQNVVVPLIISGTIDASGKFATKGSAIWPCCAGRTDTTIEGIVDGPVVSGHRVDTISQTNAFGPAVTQRTSSCTLSR